MVTIDLSLLNVFDANRLFLAVGISILDLLLIILPVVVMVLPRLHKIMQAITGWLEQRLNKKQRTRRARFFRGLCVTVVVGVLIMAALRAVDIFSLYLPKRYWIDVIILLLCVQQSRTMLVVRRALGNGSKAALPQKTKIIKDIYDGGQPIKDEHGFYRSLVEYLADHLVAHVMMPLLVYVVFGLPAVVIVTLIDGAARAVDYPTQSTNPFGVLIKTARSILYYIPGLVTGLVVSFACVFVSSANPMRAFATVSKHAGQHSLYAPWLAEAAFAGAFNTALGGGHRAAKGAPAEWVGSGRARLEHGDVQRALLLFGASCLVFTALLALLFYGRAMI